MFEIGDKVRLIIDPNMTGTVENFGGSVNGRDYALVRLNNGGLSKLYIDSLELVPETIAITIEDFQNAVCNVIDPKIYEGHFSDPNYPNVLCTCGIIICEQLKKELFGETADND